ncbi:MAG: hypothetical protein AAF768_12845 [Pseudomonadota bacterium]
MRYTVLGVAVLVAVGCTTKHQEPADSASCIEPGERAAMLELNVKGFDQTDGQGWRLIADRECYSEAAELIAEYRAQADDPNIARHHQVQMHAAAEEREQAIILLDELIAEDKTNGEWANVHYRRATRAFLASDLEMLQASRADLATLPAPKGFADAAERFKRDYPNFPAPKWPPNLDVVDAFIACFDKSYNEAYSGETCRDAGKAPAYGG